MSLDPGALRSLARDLGVSTDFWGWDGTRKQVADTTLVRVLAALGHEVADDADVRRIRGDRARAAWAATLPRVVVLREDREESLAVHVVDGTPVDVEAILEDGSRRPLTQVEDFTAPYDLDGTRRGQASFRIPRGLPLGWHTIRAHTSEGAHECPLVVTPARITVQDGLGDRRAMGVQAQLYSVRSPRSWGIGDLADARDLAAILGVRHGADFLLINPLHASRPVPPMLPSPYLPVTRRFTSALYVRPEDVPEFRDLPEHARQRIAALRSEVSPANARADRLERDPVLASKMEALEEIFAAPRTPARQALFDAYRAREGRGLEDFALWCALDEHREELPDRTREELASPDSPAAQRARTELADRITFHAWVQWVLDEQLAAAQAGAREGGMRIGLMHDLAVGVTEVGADAWRLADVLARGVGVGAPADQYNQQGQNWHQPPWHPEALAAAGYRPWRDQLRTLLRHAGALRIDHVLGLFRLWWIPDGAPASEGTYVTYDHEAMIGVLALEAQRAGAIVVGEDLGTFEPWVRDYLTERGILGTSILWFENDAAGNPLPPEDYRRLCLASVNTHDLPPTAGYLAGDHVRLRHELGLLERDLDEEIAVDAAAQAKVLDAVRARGLLDEDADPREDVEATVIALHRYLAQTPSLLVGVSLVDCVGERRIQNQPGTDSEYPNWRVPLADQDGEVVTVDDIAASARTARLLAAVREAMDAT
ncbi:4-alpha-glucanotransferase [Brachybacterium sp. MASK1Z-5]|uniref:4-alpha-glucanotransferase n=1 Tax=Brachybacterium halotolerans TaxID=2795215 RepID=A0ABS1BE73_9MICO|nr:4-alpha-glucanotransferase [Brachybacterium halotolerans]MBK0332945.1 4-alpha-glucanotransferase [Brachybacterium halotolerans]